MLPAFLRTAMESATRAAKQHLDAADPLATSASTWSMWRTVLLETRFLRSYAWLASDGLSDANRKEGTFPNFTNAADNAATPHLRALAETLPEDVESYPELIGWAFQEWQRGKKDSLQRQTAPIAAHDISPVTQLFTDADLVADLLAVALPPPLRADEEALVRFQLIDPCCGAGHILIGAFRLLQRSFVHEHNWSPQRAAQHLIEHTLHGVEIDAACAEVASLSLGLEVLRSLGRNQEAWNFWTALSSPIACFLPDEQVSNPALVLSGEQQDFAASLGSLVSSARLADPSLATLAPQLRDERQADPVAAASGNEHVHPTHIWPSSAEPQRLGRALTMLEQRYDAVCTNVPFLARGKQGPLLRAFCAHYYASSRHDLANVFLDRCLELTHQDGGQAHVLMPQNWLFLTSYKTQRQRLLRDYTWQRLHLLGEGSFESGGAAGAFAILLHLQNRAPNANTHCLLERRSNEGFSRKESALSVEVLQSSFLERSDARIVWPSFTETHPPLSKYADAFVGLQTGDDPRYLRAFWELDAPDPRIWQPLLGTPDAFAHQDGDTWLVRWEEGKGPLHASPGARADQGAKAVGQLGIAIHRLRRIFAYDFTGTRFHQNIAVIVPRDPEHYAAIRAFCHAPAFETAVRQLDQKLNVTNRTLTDVPFDLAFWQQQATTSPHNPIENPTPFRQRSFQGSAPAPYTATIQLARFLGYRWPTESRARTPEHARWYLLLHEQHHAEDPTVEDFHASLVHERAEPGHTSSDALSADVQSLRAWLRDQFFEEHCRLFLERPFLWHIWDGEPDGFAIILRYHRLDRAGLHTILHGPLARWLQSLQPQNSSRTPADRERLFTAATKLQQRLQAIHTGKAPYDVFVRWKPASAQPQGWDPDWNDGVRVNLRPFLEDPPVQTAGAGILRHRPRVHYGKDRGNDGPASQWPELGELHGGRRGDRINDHHPAHRTDRKDR